MSDEWTKFIHLQNDHTIELHTQGGFHYRTRIPRFGRLYRSIEYHFPSCDANISASGSEIYRLNLDQGRFILPLVLREKSDGEIQGVTTITQNQSIQTSSMKEASALQPYQLVRMVYVMSTAYQFVTLLYDIRAAKPFALKDQGYGLPVKSVTWIEGGRMAGDDMGSQCR